MGRSLLAPLLGSEWRYPGSSCVRVMREQNISIFQVEISIWELTRYRWHVVLLDRINHRQGRVEGEGKSKVWARSISTVRGQGEEKEPAREAERETTNRPVTAPGPLHSVLNTDRDPCSGRPDPGPPGLLRFNSTLFTQRKSKWRCAGPSFPANSRSPLPAITLTLMSLQPVSFIWY